MQLNEVRPDLYKQAAAAPAKSAAQVKAELAVAVQTGDVVVGESGARLNEIYANKYPAKPATTQSYATTSGVTRTIDISPGA